MYDFGLLLPIVGRLILLPARIRIVNVWLQKFINCRYVPPRYRVRFISKKKRINVPLTLLLLLSHDCINHSAFTYTSTSALLGLNMFPRVIALTKGRSSTSSIWTLLKLLSFLNIEGTASVEIVREHAFNMIIQVYQLILFVHFIIELIPVEHFVSAPLISFVEETVFYILIFHYLGLIIVHDFARIYRTHKLRTL
jgi:hypothetical protein